MSYKMIATWRMALDGVKIGCRILDRGGTPGDAVEKAVMAVENNPLFVSVGNGGLPNRDCQVELDAAFMDGDTMDYGGVIAVRNIKNPICAARLLSKQARNMLLSGTGAEAFAQRHQLEFQNMLTDYAKEKWMAKRLENFEAEQLEAYDGHDTVCILALDGKGAIAAGASTSGLFMKAPGRVGDSPIIGSGIYCDNRYGGAAATGVGEDIMKGCLSYEIVRLMKDGFPPQRACERALLEHKENLERRGHPTGSMAVIAMDMQGSIGAATTKKEFPIVCGDAKGETVYIANIAPDLKSMEIVEASDEWLDKYLTEMARYIGN